MELEKFIRDKTALYRRYLIIYKALSFLSVILFLFLISVFFNFGDLFKLIPMTEPYVGLALKIPLFTVRYEHIFLFIIVCLVTIVLLSLYKNNKNKIYRTFRRAPPKREKATDVIERTYPRLKDRLMAAYDNREEENIIAVDLKTSVSKDVEIVSSAELMNKKQIISGLLAIFVCVGGMCLIFYTGSTSSWSPGDLIPPPSGTIPMPPPSSGGEENNNSSGPPQGTPPISNDPGIDIDVTLPPGSGFGPGDLLENSSDAEFKPSMPVSPEHLSSGHYYENLPPGYQDVIREYFHRLAERN